MFETIHRCSEQLSFVIDHPKLYLIRRGSERGIAPEGDDETAE